MNRNALFSGCCFLDMHDDIVMSLVYAVKVLQLNIGYIIKKMTLLLCAFNGKYICSVEKYTSYLSLIYSKAPSVHRALSLDLKLGFFLGLKRLWCFHIA